jgi:hypothetical protein
MTLEQYASIALGGIYLVGGAIGFIATGAAPSPGTAVTRFSASFR